MPIIKQCTIKHVFDRLFIDSASGTATVYFSKYIDEVRQPGDVVFNAGPELVGPLLYAVPPDPTRTRSADIAISVYELAVQHGWLDGTIS